MKHLACLANNTYKMIINVNFRLKFIDKRIEKMK